MAESARQLAGRGGGGQAIRWDDAGEGPAAPDVRLREAPAQGEWSAVEVLAHLRSCADVWGRSITRILDEERPTIRAVNPTTWIRETNYPTLEFAPSLAMFAAQRGELLARLDGADWTRTATLTGGGTPRSASETARRVFDGSQDYARSDRARRTEGNERVT